jgi:hypothetical protein
MSFVESFTSNANEPCSRVLAHGVYKTTFDATRDQTRKCRSRLTGTPVLCNEFTFKDAGKPPLRPIWSSENHERGCLPPYIVRVFGRIEAVERVTDEVRFDRPHLFFFFFFFSPKEKGAKYYPL